MDSDTPGSSVLHYLPEFAQLHVHWGWEPTISSSVVPFSSCLQLFPASGSSPMSQFYATGGQSIGASALASVLPVKIQGWFPLGWTHLISLLICHCHPSHGALGPLPFSADWDPEAVSTRFSASWCLLFSVSPLDTLYTGSIVLILSLLPLLDIYILRILLSTVSTALILLSHGILSLF